ncbi:unnamed protein product [Candidula unifasciata]|uniref:Serine/threonine-protein kinase PLK4 n=1 Tax=Candidula unifasciata TaxID=100452 RepID=A0A8S3Z6U5_9EUPU|nr:unnamed protein product [Candidula unifasciata]
MSELSKGTGIENYEVRHLLGKGGFACVYSGYDKVKKIEVAIKMIEQKKIKSGHLYNRVKQEVAIHFRLKHPSVLELYDVFQDSNYVYLILELCHNGQMQQYLDTHSKTLTEDEARAVMHQVIEGILYLHSHGIVHRDLSLANLLLTKDMHVKISDFGVSTTLEDPNQKHYTMCGTPNYMSPEIITRSAHGQETDVWSLGVMLYICLVGKRPFESGGVHSTLKRVVQGEYELPGTLSPEASDLIQKMLRKAENRISIQDILTHPFMRVKPAAAKITNKIADMSMDSGCGTISSTKHSTSSSSSNLYAPSRRNQPMPAFPLQQFETHKEENRSNMSIGSSSSGSRSLSYISQSSSLSDRHPPSPPVRERDSQSEEELRRSKAAMRNIKKHLSQPQNIHSAAHREVEAKSAATNQPHFHSLQSNDHQTAQRQYQTFDPRRYKDPDCSSNYNNSGLQPVQHSERVDQYRGSQQLQQMSQNISVDPQNMQTQDLACTVYNFVAKDETQKRLKNSQPVELFSSPEPASRKVKLTEKEMQHCLTTKKKTTLKSDKKRASPELYSLGPAFSTQGLTPLRQKSSVAVMNILESGNIVVEFTVKKGQVETVSDVIIISSDGMQVTRYKPEVAIPVGDHPTLIPEHCETFVYPHFPEKLVKKYMFAAKMVKILKDKLPKVTIYTSRAKCCLTESSSFSVEFYDGVRALSDGKSVQIIDSDGTSLTLTSAELNPRLSQETLEMLEYVQQCRDLCIKIDQAISSVQALVPGTDRLFPITIGSTSAPLRLKPAQGSGSDSNAHKQMTGDSATTCALTSMSQMSSPSNSDSSLARAELPGSDVRCQTFVPGVGWASQKANGDTSILFQDGTRLGLTATKVIYCTLSGSSSEYSRREDFPVEVRNKLVHVGEVVKIIQAKSQVTSTSARSSSSSSAK